MTQKHEAARVLSRLQNYARGAALSVSLKITNNETRDMAADVLRYEGDPKAVRLLVLMLSGEVGL